MIDLDALEEIDQIENINELYCQFGAALLSKRISYNSWCVLTMGFGIYQTTRDIPEDEKRITEDLINEIENIYRRPGSVEWMREVMWITTCLEGNYTAKQQLRVVQILRTYLQNTENCRNSGLKV